MGRHQLCLLLRSGLLEHKVQFCGVFAVHHKHAVVGSLFGAGPQAVANDIGFGYLLQRFGSAHQDVATGYERMERVGCFAHDLAVEGHL